LSQNFLGSEHFFVRRLLESLARPINEERAAVFVMEFPYFFFLSVKIEDGASRSSVPLVNAILVAPRVLVFWLGVLVLPLGSAEKITLRNRRPALGM
jgi:hypothetical protein